MYNDSQKLIRPLHLSVMRMKLVIHKNAATTDKTLYLFVLFNECQNLYSGKTYFLTNNMRKRTC